MRNVVFVSLRLSVYWSHLQLPPFFCRQHCFLLLYIWKNILLCIYTTLSFSIPLWIDLSWFCNLATAEGRSKHCRSSIGGTLPWSRLVNTRECWKQRQRQLRGEHGGYRYKRDVMNISICLERLDKCLKQSRRVCNSIEILLSEVRKG